MWSRESALKCKFRPEVYFKIKRRRRRKRRGKKRRRKKRKKRRKRRRKRKISGSHCQARFPFSWDVL